MLTFTPADSLYQSTYSRLLGNIPVGFYANRGFVLPYSMLNGNTFNAQTDDSTNSANTWWLNVIDNNVPLTTLIMLSSNQLFNLNLQPGVHNLSIEQRQNPGDANPIYVTTVTITIANFAVWLQAYAMYIWDNIGAVLEDNELQLNSLWSTRRTEYLLPFRHLLVPSRSARTLATRLALNAMINMSGSGLGVQDFLTGLTFQTPVTKYLRDRSDAILVPGTFLLTSSEQFGGYDFHIWMQNQDAVRWSTFLQLRNRIGNYTIVNADEYVVSVQQPEGPIYVHTFDDTQPGGFLGPINGLFDMFKQTVVGVAISGFTEIVFNTAVQNLTDLVIVSPLGRRLLDSGTYFDSGTPLDYKDCYSDISGDGWLGYHMKMLDSGGTFDTYQGQTTTLNKLATPPVSSGGVPYTLDAVQWASTEAGTVIFANGQQIATVNNNTATGTLAVPLIVGDYIRFQVSEIFNSGSDTVAGAVATTPDGVWKFQSLIVYDDRGCVYAVVDPNGNEIYSTSVDPSAAEVWLQIIPTGIAYSLYFNNELVYLGSWIGTLPTILYWSTVLASGVIATSVTCTLLPMAMPALPATKRRLFSLACADTYTCIGC